MKDSLILNEVSLKFNGGFMKKIVEVKSISKDEPVCQNCRRHTNKPSFCNDKERMDYVKRKDTCGHFHK